MGLVNTEKSLPHGLAVLVVIYLSVTLGWVTKAVSGGARSRTWVCVSSDLDSEHFSLFSPNGRTKLCSSVCTGCCTWPRGLYIPGHISFLKYVVPSLWLPWNFWAVDPRVCFWESLWVSDSGSSLWRSSLMWCSAAVLGLMDGVQTVPLSPARLRLSLAFTKDGSLGQISCLGLF